MNEETIYRAIPALEQPKIIDNIELCDSSFVEIISDDFIKVELQYPILNMQNAVDKCFVMQEVYEKLMLVKKFLPDGLKLKIWDAWRPFDLQFELYKKYCNEIIKSFRLENKPEKEKRDIISQYVSFPKKSRFYPPVHTTGGAVDVTLIDSSCKELDMGTVFDAFSEKTRSDYFETYADSHIKYNRRILYNAMINAGFSNLPSEWWHYDYGDGFWAYYNNRPSKYPGVFDLNEVVRNWRKIRM